MTTLLSHNQDVNTAHLLTQKKAPMEPCRLLALLLKDLGTTGDGR
jgi:hypothetical protein